VPRTSLLALTLILFGCGEKQKGPMGPGTPGNNIVTGSNCPVPPGPGLAHQGTVTSDQTWTAADGPHVVESGLVVSGATLTLEPCAVVLLGRNASIEVGDSSGPPSAIVAHGTAQVDDTGEVTDLRPVIFAPAEEGVPWGSISVGAKGRIDFLLVGLVGGGSPDVTQNRGGTIVAVGSGSPPLQPLVRAIGVYVGSSGGYGVSLQSYAAFSEDSNELVVEGSAAEPIFVAAPAAQTIPAGAYLGNGRDEIFVHSPNRLAEGEDETFHDRGVPYRFGGDLYLAPTASAGLVTLTLEAGVTLRFPKQGSNTYGLDLGGGSAGEYRARLIADGTAAKPIVLTSGEESPAPGDWVGIKWGGGPTTGNVMRHVRIEYAGADSQANSYGCGPKDNDAALLIYGWQPTEAFVESCTFAHSAAGGIVSGWSSDVSGPELKTGNSFADIANGCEVSVPKAASGACPGGDFTPDCY
jgi:hypothetical protein